MNVPFSRRDCLRAMGNGFGTLALAGLLEDSGLLAGGHQEVGHGLTPRTGQFPAKAKAVVQLFQNGGPSQMDLFDPKPELTRRQGQPHPEELETFQLGNKNVLLGSPFRFEQYGQSGMQFSEVVPHLAALADDLCMVRSMYTESNNHPFAINMMQTGKTFSGHPAIGSWIGYALGTENRNLPAYVVLRDPAGYNTSGKTVWSSGWLPTLYQGTEFSASGTPVLHLQPSRQRSAAAQVRSRELLAHLNVLHADRHPRENELETRIKNFELAARMQLVASEILDLSRESQDTHRRYGLDNRATSGYGMRCLLARRLIEAGVRFVQVFPPSTPDFQPWDNHSKLSKTLPEICRQVEQPSAALIADLKERGLLNDVVVMWAGEFGRLPITEGAAGRDHNRNAFTVLMAGGGFHPGLTYGTTDEFGYRAVQNRVSVPDLHATILHQLGIDHRQLDYLHMGRAERLTDPDVTGAQVVDQLLS